MFTFPQRLGLFMIIEAAILSLTAVSLILCLAVYKWLRRTVLTWGRTRIRSPDASDSSLFLNLMVADLIQATGNLPSLRWMADANITEGPLCTAQAAIKQVGIVGVSMTSLAIAVHTFAVLVLRWRATHFSSLAMIAGVWAFVGLVIGIPNAIHRNEVYYGNTGYWCWIEQRFKAEQIVTEYLWVWVAGLLMIILYTMMFLVIKGWFIVDNGIHWHKNYNANGVSAELETDEDKQTKAIAKLMLFYPAVYIFCVLPNTISRWLYFSGFTIPYQLTLSSNTVFALSGAFNVLVFFITRPQLVLGPDIRVTDEPEEIPLDHKKGSSGHSTRKHGHLPERRIMDKYSSESIHEGWGNPQPDFDARALLDRSVHHSPAGYQVSSLPYNHNPGTAYPPAPNSNQPPQFPRESHSLMENDDYGHLPQA